jgi:hypothetical protein
MLTPVIILNNSPARRIVPAVGAPKFSFPGLALAYAISWGIVSTGSDGVTETRVWDAKNARDRHNIADEIEIEFVEKCRTDRVRGDDIEERVAVRRCSHRRLGPDIATCAGSSLDNELLTEPV